MIIASLLLALAIWLNKDDKKMLLLTLIVGLSYFLPVHFITDRAFWYVAVISAEMFVLVAALFLKTKASYIVAIVCAMLEINHINGLFFGGHLEGSPYGLIVPYLEYIELLACSLFSMKVIEKLKGLYHHARY